MLRQRTGSAPADRQPAPLTWLRRLWLGLAMVGLAMASPSPAQPLPASPASNRTTMTARVSQPGEIRFAIIGDYGDGGPGEAEVASLIRGWQPDFIITTGDNRYVWMTYDRVVGRYFCAFMKKAGSGTFCHGGNGRTNAFFPSLGNHDYEDGGGINEYLAYFTLPGNERYYDFVRGPVHFFVLNSNPQEPDGNGLHSSQAAWLRKRLSSSTSPWRIVYFHHAPFSSAEHGPTPWMQWPFGEWGADAVISGHDHTYERLQIDGLPYFVNGLGGGRIYRFHAALPQSVVRYNEDHGAMLVEADASGMRFSFISRRGQLIDTFSLRKALHE